MSEKSLRDEIKRLREVIKNKDEMVYKALAAISDDPGFCRLRLMRILKKAYEYGHQLYDRPTPVK